MADASNVKLIIAFIDPDLNNEQKDEEVKAIEEFVSKNSTD